MPTLKQLIEAKKLDWVNGDINEDNFPKPEEIRTDFKLYHFNMYISSEDAIKKMKKDGYSPATVYELLTWKDWNGKDYVVALGSVVEVGGGRGVACLGRYGSGRGLSLGWFGGDWYGRCRFLAVRNSSISTSDSKSALGHFEPWTLDSAIKMVKDAGYELNYKPYYITGQGEVYQMPKSNRTDTRRAFLGSYSTKEEAERVRDEIKSKYGNN